MTHDERIQLLQEIELQGDEGNAVALWVLAELDALLTDEKGQSGLRINGDDDETRLCS